MADIVLYGATGFTGNLVAEQLAAGDASFVLAGRNETKLETLANRLADGFDSDVETCVASVDDPASLDAMMASAKVLINCAGPFSDVGKPVVQRAVANGLHYLDTTGEQHFMKWVQTRLAGDASQQGTVLMPGCAFEYVTGNCAAKVALEKGAHHLGICYATRGMAMSHGTKMSVVRSIASPGFGYEGGSLEQRRAAYRVYDVPFPDGRVKKGLFFPGGEPLTVPQMGRVKTVESVLAVSEPAAKFLNLMSPVLPTVLGALSGVLDKLIKLTSGDPHELGARPDFLVIAFDPRNSEFFSAVAGKDPYAVTARVIVEAATRLARGEAEDSGFVQIPDIFDTRDFLDAVGLSLILDRRT
jgi:NAD(P)-dependent dehydrogenase (short-subunit alcohol dehydrogenase family)